MGTVGRLPNPLNLVVPAPAAGNLAAVPGEAASVLPASEIARPLSGALPLVARSIGDMLQRIGAPRVRNISLFSGFFVPEVIGEILSNNADSEFVEAFKKAFPDAKLPRFFGKRSAAERYLVQLMTETIGFANRLYGLTEGRFRTEEGGDIQDVHKVYMNAVSFIEALKLLATRSFDAAWIGDKFGERAEFIVKGWNPGGGVINAGGIPWLERYISGIPLFDPSRDDDRLLLYARLLHNATEPQDVKNALGDLTPEKMAEEALRRQKDQVEGFLYALMMNIKCRYGENTLCKLLPHFDNNGSEESGKLYERYAGKLFEEGVTEEKRELYRQALLRAAATFLAVVGTAVVSDDVPEYSYGMGVWGLGKAADREIVLKETEYLHLFLMEYEQGRTDDHLFNLAARNVSRLVGHTMNYAVLASLHKKVKKNIGALIERCGDDVKPHLGAGGLEYFGIKAAIASQGSPPRRPNSEVEDVLPPVPARKPGTATHGGKATQDRRTDEIPVDRFVWRFKDYIKMSKKDMMAALRRDLPRLPREWLEAFANRGDDTPWEAFNGAKFRMDVEEFRDIVREICREKGLVTLKVRPVRQEKPAELASRLVIPRVGAPVPQNVAPIPQDTVPVPQTAAPQEAEASPKAVTERPAIAVVAAAKKAADTEEQPGQPARRTELPGFSDYARNMAEIAGVRFKSSSVLTDKFWKKKLIFGQGNLAPNGKQWKSQENRSWPDRSSIRKGIDGAIDLVKSGQVNVMMVELEWQGERPEDRIERMAVLTGKRLK